MPQPCGLGFVMIEKVDADNVFYTVMYRTKTGFLLYSNSAPIYWRSKKNNSVESSYFGS